MSKIGLVPRARKFGVVGIADQSPLLVQPKSYIQHVICRVLAHRLLEYQEKHITALVIIVLAIYSVQVILVH